MLKIFEIKLYGLSPKQFEEKLDKERKKFYSICEAQNRTKIESMQLYSHFYAHKNTYENYSIGYLEILYDGAALHYDVKIMLSKRFSSQKEIRILLNELESDNTLSQEEKDLKKAAILDSHSLVPYKPRLFTEKKKYMSNYHVGGIYTGIFGLKNIEIAQAIKEDLELVQKDELLKNVYFDFSHFNEMVNYIDFISLFDYYKANRNNKA
jgi:hypothetical protein